MSLRPKPSRMERQVRNQARGLFLVSAVLLLACTTMTGLYGWSLGSGLVDAIAFCAAFAAADIGGAYLISLSGTCAAAKETAAARRAARASFICMVMTFIGLLGFQAQNREAQVFSRETAISVAAGFVDWAKGMAYKDVPKDKKAPSAVASSIDAVGGAVQKQLDILNSGTVKNATDGQSATIARMTGLTEAQARSWTIGLTSAVLLFIQYSLWWAYGFTRQKLEPAISNLAHGPLGSSNGKPGVFPDTVRKVRFETAKKDALVNTEADVELCNGEYATRWGVTESQASKWITKIIKGGEAKQEWRGQRKVLVKSPKPRIHVNGNGHAVGNA